ncbi:MAG: AAA family ATPase [Hyphomonadaceae bacterium]|nr:AAA family ATPase [Hyphomonadaceae bacterium]
MKHDPAEAEDAWSVGTPDEVQFVLEEDDAFGLGEIETAEAPPFDDGEAADALLAAEPAEPPAPEAANEHGLTTPMPAMPPAANDASADQPLPRITIHAFCDRPEIARMIDQVAQDRRMAKAQIKVEMGGIEAGIVRLASQASPNLLIIDTIAHGPAMLDGLDRLAEVVEEGAKVVIIGAVNDIGLFRELMKRGASEYIVPPVKPLQLIRAIASLYVNPQKPFVGRLISVVGARGGVGASTLAHNIAWSIAERQEAGAALVDLDLPFGTAALDFNQDPGQSIADALTAPDRADENFLDRIVTRQTPRLQVFTAPGKLEREYELDASAFEVVIDRIRRSGPYIVLDLPHVWTSWVKQTLLASDDVVIVAAPDLASLRNARNMVDLLKSARPYDQPPRVVLNTVGVPKRPEVPTKDFADALGLEPLAALAFDPALFGAAANNGQMLAEVAPASKAAVSLDDLAAILTGRKPVEQKRTALVSKLPFLKK